MHSPTAVVGALRESESGEAAELLAWAFRDNPLNRAVIRGDAARRLRCNRIGMQTTFGAVLGHAHILAARPEGVAEGGLLGVLLSAPPHRYPFPRPALGAQLRCLWGQGFGVQKRWSKVYDRLFAIHPREPHWYLSILGVSPDRQGGGVGTRLLEDWLLDVDAHGHPAYLETDREQNLAFYGKAGFEISRELEVLDVPIWCLWRPAR